jgi:serine phosphatase RsbU (regulator of sigma subunit)
MIQFLPLGLQIPSDHPDRKRYFSMQLRSRPANSSDVAEITLMSPGDILFLYTDGVYDGSDAEERQHLEVVMQEHYSKSARDICTAVLEHATKEDDRLRQMGEENQIDDKTVFIIKRG